MSLVLGLDVGTQGTKGLLLDVEAGCVLERASASYGLMEGLPPGAAEQDPETWIEAVRSVAGQLMSSSGVDPERVLGVGVSGQQHGLVALDAEDRVVRPAKLWCDTSTVAEALELTERFGRRVPTGFTAPKILWLARHEPDNWERTRSVLLPHDYVNLRLVGERVSEAGDASGSGLFDPEQRRYCEADAASLDERLPAMLPRLLAPGERAGCLTSAGAELLGLPVGTPVSAGGGDNMLSAVGSGATRPGTAVLSLGTSGTVFTWCDRPVIDPEGLIAPFCASVGGWLPLLCVMNLTGVTEEVRARSGTGHAELTEEARGVPAGCDGLLWLPYLAGERVPDLPEAAGVLTGMRTGSLSRGVLYRAALEGTSLNLAWGVSRMRSLGLPIEELHLVGGAARNELWRQILADTLSCPVIPLLESESAALGAALQALWTERLAAGEDTTADDVAAPFVQRAGQPSVPQADNVSLYAEQGERFRELARRLFDVD